MEEHCSHCQCDNCLEERERQQAKDVFEEVEEIDIYSCDSVNDIYGTSEITKCPFFVDIKIENEDKTLSDIGTCCNLTGVQFDFKAFKEDKCKFGTCKGYLPIVPDFCPFKKCSNFKIVVKKTL